MRLVRPRRWLLPLLAAIVFCAAAGAALAADGELDPSLDGDGRAIGDITAFDDGISDVVIDAAGRYVVVGTGFDPKGMLPSKAEVARFLPNGELDKSFSGDGFDLIPWTAEGFASASSVALDSAGRIVVGGDAVPAKISFDFAVARYLPSGELDRSFSGDGLVTLDVPGAGIDIGRAVAVDALDRVILAGQAVTPGTAMTPPVGRMGIARFTALGAPDSSFDGDGVALVSFIGKDNSLASSLAIDGAGRIVVAGTAGNLAATVGEFAVARLLDEGAFDLGFGDAGRATLDFGTLAQEDLRDMVLDAEGRIVVAGQAGFAPSYVAHVGRFLPGGAPDPGFGGGDGKTTTTIEKYVAAEAVAVDRAGRVVVAGVTGTSLAQDAALLRYTPAGELDQGFGGKGLVREDFLAANAFGNSLAIDPEGRYVLAGTAIAAGGARSFALARFTTSYPTPVANGPPPSGSSPPNSQPAPKPPLCGGVAATIVGSAGKDRVTGTAKRDVIATLGGDDQVRALGGNDLVCAGAGKDLVVGGPGADRLLGEGGADRLLGGPGKDALLGEAGADQLLGGPGKDALAGGPGKDVQR